MATYNGIDDLLNNMERDIKNIMSINGEMARQAKTDMRQHVLDDVYETYSPDYYERRGDSGGLSDISNIKIDTIQNISMVGIILKNITKNDKNGRWIVEFVEYGSGYTYWKNAFARPFNEKMQEEYDKGKTGEIINRELRKKGWIIN
jgi:hypothetical protein